MNPSATTSVSPRDERVLDVALAGCGDISAMHLAAIDELPGARLVGVCDVDADAARAAGDPRGVPVFTSLDDMLDAAAPDVLHVCTPHWAHAPMAEVALARGVHVLTEKPVGRTPADADGMQAAAEASTAQLGVCFQNRYNPVVAELHRRVSDGRYGRVTGAFAQVLWHRDAAYYARRPWRGSLRLAGGGALINQSIHTLDLLQWLVGDVVGVDGLAQRLLMPDPVEVEDTARVRMRHRAASGDLVTSELLATTTHPVDEPVVVTVVTERATLRLQGDLTITTADGRVETVAAPIVATGPRSYWGSYHGLLIDDFHEHVRQDRPFWLDATEARKSLDVLAEVYRQSGIEVPAHPGT